MDYQPIFRQLYQDFNARRHQAVLAHMHPDVQWPKAFEGGYVRGYDEISAYWTRQWTEINPIVTPIDITLGQPGTIEVKLHQLVTDWQGKVLFDGLVKHVYTLQGELIERMDIELI
ncbi:nuclear transport factor 2 family protein [Spirosoma lituiforme]